MIPAIVDFDISVTEFFANTAHSPFWDKVMVFITSLGDSGFIWILCGIVLLFFKKTRTWGTALLFSLALTFALSQLVLKDLVDRPRPFLLVDNINLLISIPGGSSFPSSHAATAFASAMSLFCFSKKYGAIALCVAALIAFSRLYLCVHFLSDIVAGMILGAAMGAFITYFLFFKRKTEDEPE